MTEQPESGREGVEGGRALSVMTATHEGRTIVAAPTLQEQLEAVSFWLKVVAAIGCLALLGVLAILLVKWDTVMAVLGRVVG